MRSSDKEIKALKERATAGDSKAQYQLGDYYNGRHVDRDIGKAIELYKKAAAQGYGRAQYALAVCYEYGGEGIDRDIGKAIEFYKKATDQGFNRSNVHYGLAMCYEKDGPQHDLQKAIEHLEIAVKKGFGSGAPEWLLKMKIRLATCYEKGEGGFPKDVEKALTLYKKIVKSEVTMFSNPDSLPQQTKAHLITLQQVLQRAWEEVAEQKNPDEQLKLFNEKRKELIPILNVPLDKKGTIPLEKFIGQGNQGMVTQLVKAGAIPRLKKTTKNGKEVDEPLDAYIKRHTPRSFSAKQREGMKMAIEQGMGHTIYQNTLVENGFLPQEVASLVGELLEEENMLKKREYGKGEEKVPPRQSPVSTQESDRPSFLTSPPSPSQPIRKKPDEAPVPAHKKVVVHESKDQGDIKKRLDHIREERENPKKKDWTGRVQPSSPPEVPKQR